MNRLSRIAVDCCVALTLAASPWPAADAAARLPPLRDPRSSWAVRSRPGHHRRRLRHRQDRLLRGGEHGAAARSGQQHPDRDGDYGGPDRRGHVLRPDRVHCEVVRSLIWQGPEDGNSIAVRRLGRLDPQWVGSRRLCQRCGDHEGGIGAFAEAEEGRVRSTRFP